MLRSAINSGRPASTRLIALHWNSLTLPSIDSYLALTQIDLQDGCSQYVSRRYFRAMAVLLVERSHADYVLSTDRARLDLDVIHGYLATVSYWAKGRPRETQRRAIEGSHLVIGAYTQIGFQVGFARMVTDLATWAWLCDVFILPEHQGRGLGTAMVKTIVEHPDVVDVTWQFLATADAHDVYARFGYTPLDDPTRWMHRRGPT